MLKHCPTTSPKDRKRIYNERLRNRRTNNSRSSGNTANTQRRPATNAAACTTPPGTTSSKLSTNANANNASKISFINCVNTGSSNTQGRIIPYDEDVIIDSSASDHIARDLSDLTDPYPFMAQVLLPDNSLSYSEVSGTMRIQTPSQRTGQHFVVPLFDALLVPAFSKRLWSVIAFTTSGHEIIFGDTTIQIIFNSKTPNKHILYLGHPYFHRDQNWPSANAIFVRRVTANSSAVHLNQHVLQEEHPSQEESPVDDANLSAYPARGSTSSEPDFW